MIDVIPVNSRFCWEPLCGGDTAIYIDVSEDATGHIINNEYELKRHDWTEVLMVDMRGQRVYICFNGDIDDNLAAEIFMRLIDIAMRKYTISGITTLRGEGYNND
jgi:hypothetical protein